MTRLTDIKAMPASEAVRKLNPDLFEQRAAEAVRGLPTVKDSLIARHAVTKEGKRLRQDTKGPNKLEREFEAWLREEWKVTDPWFHAQGLTLLIANGVRYTPDMVVVFADGSGTCGVWAYETKGFMRDDAAVKIKVAACVYPWIKFHLVTKRKKRDGGGWAIEEVLS